MLLIVLFIINGQLTTLEGWHPLLVDADRCHVLKKNIEEYLDLIGDEAIVLCEEIIDAQQN